MPHMNAQGKSCTLPCLTVHGEVEKCWVLCLAFKAQGSRFRGDSRLGAQGLGFGVWGRRLRR